MNARRPHCWSTLSQVMALCRHATSHYLNQCWPLSLTPYGDTSAQCVKACSHQHDQNWFSKAWHCIPVLQNMWLRGINWAIQTGVRAFAWTAALCSVANMLQRWMRQLMIPPREQPIQWMTIIDALHQRQTGHRHADKTSPRKIGWPIYSKRAQNVLQIQTCSSPILCRKYVWRLLTSSWAQNSSITNSWRTHGKHGQWWKLSAIYSP